MNIQSLTPENLRLFFPNTLAEVEGEPSLFDKLLPWIEAAKDWIESEYLGPDDFLSDEHLALALRIVVAKAFADAIPSLDLVLSASGFGVISTNSLAPASKDRVERLIQSLNQHVDRSLRSLVDDCHQYPQWRLSERGRYFCASFLSSLKCLDNLPQKSYDIIRSDAIRVELLMAENYFGFKLMDRLRDEFNANFLDFDLLGTPPLDMYCTVFDIVKSQNFSLPNIWKLCRPTLNKIKSSPDYYKIWHDEMGAKFDRKPFANDIKGSFYF